MLKQVNLSFINSKRLLWFIAACWVAIMAVYKPWQKNLIVNDVVSYYAYLPAEFIYDDIYLQKSDYHTKEDTYLFWPVHTADGRNVIKTTMGLSILYAPFFFVGHIAAKLCGAPLDGFSTPYQFCVLMGCLFYLLAGLYFLRKLLLLFFSDTAVCITLLGVLFGTNLLWYTTLNGLMAHGYLFSILTLFIYHTLKWHREPRWSTAACLGLELGLLVLIRPTLITCVLIFLLFGINDAASFKESFRRFKKGFLQLLVMALCFFIVLLPQLLYWKAVAGKWLFFPYVDERFYFNHPHIIEGLFSFRKGWLIYTPLMLFAIAGIFYLRRQRSPFFLAILLLVPLYMYILFSWWSWWYGGGFGMRAMVDLYGLLAVPMAAFYDVLLRQFKPQLKYALLALTAFFIYLNLFQTMEYEKGLIHYDAMTKDAYFAVFLNKKPTRFYEYLSDPEYKRAKAGLPETYTSEEVLELQPSDRIHFKGTNFKIIGFDTESSELRSDYYDMGELQTFRFQMLGNGKVAIIAANGKYISADHSKGDVLLANRDQAQAWETFDLVYLDNNTLALKSDNGKYVSIGTEEPYRLTATSAAVSYPETLHFFINF